ALVRFRPGALTQGRFRSGIAAISERNHNQWSWRRLPAVYKQLASRLEAVLLKDASDLGLHGALDLAAGLPAGEAHAHDDRVDFVHDTLDDLGRDFGLEFLEDLTAAATALVA